MWIEICEIYHLTGRQFVTPYAGVWIEILTETTLKSDAIVTPYAGVWIEIVVSALPVYDFVSLPTRECGLK